MKRDYNNRLVLFDDNRPLFGFGQPDRPLTDLVAGGFIDCGLAGCDSVVPEAVFVSENRITKGNWKGQYGSIGHNLLTDVEQAVVLNDTDGVKLEVSTGSSIIWNPYTLETHVPQGLDHDVRTASCIVGDPIRFRVISNDNKSRRWSLYFLDYDKLGRGLSIQIRDLSDAKVIDRQALEEFEEGVYLTWDISGTFEVVIEATSGPNAVVSAWFFDDPALLELDGDRRQLEVLKRTDSVALASLLNPPYSSDDANAFLEHLRGPEKLAGFIDFMIQYIWPRDHKGIFWGDRLLSLDKSAGFFDDPAFASAYERIRGAHVYDQYSSKDTIAWRLHTLVWAARQALVLPEGDFVECGTFQGDMADFIYEVVGLSGGERQFYLYDSFSGFDPEQTDGSEFVDVPNYRDFANKIYSKKGLYESVVDRFQDKPEIRIHRGYLPGTLEGSAPDKIAFLHLDLNSAKPEVGCLEFLFDRILSGGIIIFDDYGWSVFRAQKAAEDAFFAERGLSILELPTGQGLVVKP